jgi:hypothetical protein
MQLGSATRPSTRHGSATRQHLFGQPFSRHGWPRPSDAARLGRDSFSRLAKQMALPHFTHIPINNCLLLVFFFEYLLQVDFSGPASCQQHSPDV